VQDSLHRLSTDRIDLLQLHLPDPATPLDDTLATLGELVDEGSIRHVGCSNFMVWEVAEWMLTAAGRGLPEFVSVQTEFSMLVREAESELLRAGARFGFGLIPYRPLAQGFLTGKYRRDRPPPPGTRLATQEAARKRRFRPENFDVLEVLLTMAEEKRCTPAQLAIAWLLTFPAVASVIAGASNPDQLRDNAGAAGVDMTADDLTRVAAVLPEIPGGVVGALHLRPDSAGT
jgi:aryl-alcohol dehydrogenase-like predicted oxidoreductase